MTEEACFTSWNSGISESSFLNLFFVKTISTLCCLKSEVMDDLTAISFDVWFTCSLEVPKNGSYSIFVVQ